MSNGLYVICASFVHSLTDGFCDGRAAQGTEEIEHGRESDRLTRREHFRRDDRGNRVCSVVEAVGVGKAQYDDQDHQQEDQLSHR